MRIQPMLALAGLLGLAVPAESQQRDVRATWDTLAAIRDVPVLMRLERSFPLPGQARSADPVIGRGLVALRVFELTGDREDYRRAHEALERGTERFSGDARAHHALALAHAGAPDARVPGPGGVLDGVTVAQSFAEIFGRDGRSRARNSLRRSLEIDPAYASAAVMLAELAVLDGRDRDDLEAAKRALQAARAAGGERPELARALADVEMALGDYEAAATAADRSVADAPADASALHARAVAYFLQPRGEARGAEAYFAGIERLDAAAAERYWADLDVIAAANERAEWQRSDASGRRLLLRRFWSRRAADGGVTEAERVAEHYRRLAEARRRYLRNSRRGVDGQGVLLGDAASGSVYDDRGIVLLNRGLPAQVVRTQGGGVLPNESWVYGTAEGNLLFHFVALRGANDFSLVSDVFQAMDPAIVLRPEQRELALATLLEDRAPYEPGYQIAATRLRRLIQSGEALNGTEIRILVEEADADYRQRARRALERDWIAPRFTRSIVFHYDLFAFRSPFARTDLTAAVAIPTDALSPLGDPEDPEYTVRLAVILLDTLQGTVARLDTIARVRPGRALAAGDFVRTHVSLPVIPSEHTVHRVVVTDATTGAGSLAAGTTRIRDLIMPGLGVSDLVLASPDTAGDFVRGGRRLALTLPRRFGPANPFMLFYEVYDLPADAPYRTRIRVEPVKKGGLLSRIGGLFGGGDDIDLRFEDIASPDPDGVVREVRRVASDLDPGRYRLHIVITNATTGETTETETEFEVTG